ncbi:MAG: glutamate synthase (NADPH), homotetrameric [Elusimicrobia bacterium HGW-Elusimicrobia-4]|nr:MAG: glutamate synthase (NADPH), homotetrameric [Elusimicrobia bacterium HGW-Elusimicrobia-4]
MEKIPRQKMPVQDVKERIKNFSSVALGYLNEQAILEAKRCIQCKKPTCIEGCPVEVDIPGFIKKIAEKNFTEAIKILKNKNNLPAVCGRVCPQETQCEIKCVLAKKGEPVAIGRLERFAADWEIANSLEFRVHSLEKLKAKDGNPQTSNSNLSTLNSQLSTNRIAVVGSGPAGLTCAADLAKMRYDVTIFESLHETGGVLMYGIPEFRLPKKTVKIEINYIKSLGVSIRTNVLIGKTKTVQELFDEGYKAIFVGTGAGLPQFLSIPGENLNRIYSANEFLTRANLMKAYKFPEYDTPIDIGKRVAVIGAGNVAMDSARVALRLGADEVLIVYRRTEKEMPARLEEIENAKEEGVILHLLTAPIRFIGDENNNVTGMECLKMELGEPDASGRRRPIPIKNSEFKFDVDTVVMAIGQSPNPLLPKTIRGLQVGKHGNIITDEKTGVTSIPGIFAGGDIATGASTVIEAMGAGKRAARAINEYIKNKKDFFDIINI